MIELTDEMVKVAAGVMEEHDEKAHRIALREGLAAVLALVERDYNLIRKLSGPGPHCPRCGDSTEQGEFGICVPCAADIGWAPKCSACIADQHGKEATGLTHLTTCGLGRKAAVRHIAELHNKALGD